MKADNCLAIAVGPFRVCMLWYVLHKQLFWPVSVDRQFLLLLHVKDKSGVYYFFFFVSLIIMHAETLAFLIFILVLITASAAQSSDYSSSTLLKDSSLPGLKIGLAVSTSCSLAFALLYYFCVVPCQKRQIPSCPIISSPRQREPLQSDRPKLVTCDPIRPLHLESFEMPSAASDEVCPICLDSLENESVSKGECSHIAHTSCLLSWLAKAKDLTSMTCPVCRSTFSDSFKSSQTLETKRPEQ